ncbi:MAG: RidA family protein [Syntrophomonadaceae bacterium]|nr:RidA family protein [Syntrophomonadaceae bacterium]
MRELGVVLSEPAKPIAAYLPGIQTNNLLFISGQLPTKDGQLLYTGKLGLDLDIAQGQDAARQCIINCMSILKQHAHNWEQLVQIIKLTGYVQSADDFYEQAQVINGASELLQKVFGEKGRHARAAIGVNALPLNAPCEIEMIALLK